MTIAVCIGAFAGLVAYDLWTGLKNGSQTTISVQMYALSCRYPIIPFVFGVIAGHLWWTQ